MRLRVVFPLSFLLSVQRLAVVEASPARPLWTADNALVAASEAQPWTTVSDSVSNDHSRAPSLRDSGPNESVFRGGRGKLQESEGMQITLSHAKGSDDDDSHKEEEEDDEEEEHHRPRRKQPTRCINGRQKDEEQRVLPTTYLMREAPLTITPDDHNIPCRGTHSIRISVVDRQDNNNNNHNNHNPPAVPSHGTESYEDDDCRRGGPHGCFLSNPAGGAGDGTGSKYATDAGIIADSITDVGELLTPWVVLLGMLGLALLSVVLVETAEFLWRRWRRRSAGGGGWLLLLDEEVTCEKEAVVVGKEEDGKR
ncbi:hypothetical protein VTN02DRAFT_6582 [Thermoascus thermophilus]